MTETLVEKTCSPCRGGIQPLTRAEAEELLPQAPEWTLMDNAHRIEKTFRFGNFQEALAFVQKVGELAEAEGHHPDISSAGAMGPCRCAPRRSRVSTRTISSPSEAGIRRHRACALDEGQRPLAGIDRVWPRSGVRSLRNTPTRVASPGL